MFLLGLLIVFSCGYVEAKKCPPNTRNLGCKGSVTSSTPPNQQCPPNYIYKGLMDPNPNYGCVRIGGYPYNGICCDPIRSTVNPVNPNCPEYTDYTGPCDPNYACALIGGDCYNGACCNSRPIPINTTTNNQPSTTLNPLIARCRSCNYTTVLKMLDSSANNYGVRPMTWCETYRPNDPTCYDDFGIHTNGVDNLPCKYISLTCSNSYLSKANYNVTATIMNGRSESGRMYMLGANYINLDCTRNGEWVWGTENNDVNVLYDQYGNVLKYQYPPLTQISCIIDGTY